MAGSTIAAMALATASSVLMVVKGRSK
ncbi:hypothetical protein [Devosia sp.]